MNTHTQTQALRLCRAVHRFHFQLLVLLGSYVKLLGILQPVLEHSGVSGAVSLGGWANDIDINRYSHCHFVCARMSSSGNARAISDVSIYPGVLLPATQYTLPSFCSLLTFVANSLKLGSTLKRVF